MNDERCPKCGSSFPANRAWAKRSVSMLLLAPALQDLNTKVRCPSCGHIFEAEEFRFLGVLSSRAFKYVVAALLLVLACASVYFLFFLP